MLAPDIEKYLIPTDNLDLTKVLETWIWLVDNKTIIALTKSGDALLKDNKGNLYFLEVGSGTIELKATNYCDFLDKKLSEELMDELLFPALVDKLEHNELMLRSGQVYSYILLPILGGTYDESNRCVLDIYEHYNLTGDIHFQLKDSPDGTTIKIKVD